ncbi:MAG: TonB-dependent receptor plug domain-containing protein, partial [Cyanobacteria bacterium P01_C01_bin.118]
MTILNKLVSHNLLASLILAVIIQPGLANSLRADNITLISDSAADSSLVQVPDSETMDELDEATEENVNETEEDTLRIVVTATRTEEPILDVPRSVTVIDREDIQLQRQLTNNLPDILGQLVPGLGPPTLQNRTRNLSLRGRTALILIDGVPQNPNSGFATELNTIDPDVIERIEIVRGPSAIYGDGATGGIINIITRAATDESITYELGATTSVGLTSIEDDSFAYGVQFGAAGSDERTDLRASLSYDVTNSFFDANGDRIP